MRTRDLIELLLLAALWGASFLFMRISTPEFGPVAMTALRVGGAALCLLPLLLLRAQAADLRRHWRAIAVVGVVNSALPFVLFGVAALALQGGLSAIFNATAPMWGALIAFFFLRERLGARRWLGAAIVAAGAGLIAFA